MEAARSLAATERLRQIDWIRDAVDDEVGYQLETVVSFTGEPAN